MPARMSKGGRTIVIGAGGRLGAALVRRFAQSRETIGFKRQDLDVTDIARIKQTLEHVDFDTLVYTAGQTNVDYCEDHPDEAFLTNAKAPQVLAEICAARKARLIHISTDYVFDGKKDCLLKETDETAPLGIYGQSKLAGEKLVLAVSEDFLVLRVSWLFGPDRPSFPDMIVQRAVQHEHVEAIADKDSCPTYSEDLAVWMEPMLDDAMYSGVLHLANSGHTSWQHYGQVALEMVARLGVPLKTHTVHGISRIGFAPFKAERPEFTAFDTSRHQSLSGTVPRPWQEALEEYLTRKYAPTR